MDLKKEMKQVYAPYCRNHDDVITLLEKVYVVVFVVILASPKVFTSDESLCNYLVPEVFLNYDAR